MELQQKAMVVNPQTNKVECYGTIIAITPITVRVRADDGTNDSQAELWPIEWVNPIKKYESPFGDSDFKIKNDVSNLGKCELIRATELALRAHARVSTLKRVSLSVKNQVKNVALASLEACKHLVTIEDARALGCQHVVEGLQQK